ITASSGGATTGSAGSVKIAIGAAAVGRISVSANPAFVGATGGTSTITASVSDSSGNALPSVPVTFTTTAGSFSPSVANTDASGSPVARVIVDFGDGSSPQTFTGQPATVTHTYNLVGAFVVRVTAVDTFGDVANASGGVTILPRPLVVVGITVSANPVAGIAT